MVASQGTLIDAPVALRERAERLGPSEPVLTWNLGRARARAALASLPVQAP